MSSGLGIGAGLAMGQQMANNLQNAQQGGGQQQAAAPKTVRERLADLKALLDDGLISEADFNQRKEQILSEV